MTTISSPGEGAELKRGRKAISDRPPRRDDLARIAFDLFAERSFDAVSIKDIGRAANVNSAMIYYYFENKDDLFRAAIEGAVNEAFALFDSLRVKHYNPKDIIGDWLDTHTTLLQPLRKMVKISLDCNGVIENIPVAGVPIRRFYDHEAEILQECIQEGIKQKIFAPVDPAALATFISTFLDGAVVRTIILESFDIATAIADFKAALWLRLGCKSSVSRNKFPVSRNKSSVSRNKSPVSKKKKRKK